jgi:cytochrome c-type biogenesis protein CcmH/NrfF
MKSSMLSAGPQCKPGPQRHANLFMNCHLMNCHPERSEGPAFCRQMRISLRRWMQAAALTAAVFLFLGAGEDSARFKDLGHRMMCTCGCGQVLLECNHVGCQSSDKMRNQLLAALDRSGGGGTGGGGAISDDLILQGFVQEYGPTVIAAPTATGFNRVAWIMPFVALAFGIAFVVYVVRSWKNRPAPALADGITIPRGSEDNLDEFRRKARKETDL